MVTFLFFDFQAFFEVFATGADAGKQFLKLARPLSHRAQGQNKPRGQTPRSDGTRARRHENYKFLISSSRCQLKFIIICSNHNLIQLT